MGTGVFLGDENALQVHTDDDRTALKTTELCTSQGHFMVSKLNLNKTVI